MQQVSFSRDGYTEPLSLLDYAYQTQSYYSRTLHVASLVGPQQSIVAVRAMIFSKGYRWSARFDGESLDPDTEHGYTVKVSKLPKYNSYHMVIRSKNPGLVLGDPNVSIARYLFSDQIDSPILPQWVPWLVEQLNKGSFVSTLRGTLDARICKFNSKTVDELVSKGVAFGKLKLLAA